MLYLVATPIGNTSDISLRAIDVLRSVHLIAAEDTRKTGLLLKHHGVAARQTPFHEHNEASALRRIVRVLEDGQDVALVTNAGTPGISDPGYTLVRAALERQIPVAAIPGPSAFVGALVLSGLPVHSFTFRGFPPRRSAARRRFFAIDRDAPHTLIFYESPHRILATMEDAQVVFGDRPCALANDLTKLFERVERGPLSEVRSALAAVPPRGEYTLVIAGAEWDRTGEARER
ncbi:MAG: 16S rRNA (cytidine(1402)-2'-O)-methyltransferase [Chloroflexi bacterium]|nr:16S rRNA (cytidine(1402)-2'-O)-methyltransferase [Chloroflexota bacterium]